MSMMKKATEKEGRGWESDTEGIIHHKQERKRREKTSMTETRRRHRNGRKRR